MKNYFLPMLLSLFFLGACDKNDEIIPEDADENFITSVVMTVDGKSYTADIADNTVTITVPYTVSLNNAEVEFKYTTSATIIPDPETPVRLYCCRFLHRRRNGPNRSCVRTSPPTLP